MIHFNKWPISIKRKLRELPIVEAIANRVSDRRFHAWQANHPGGTFGDYYAHKTIDRIDRGHSHYTLGGTGKAKGGASRIDWTPEEFAERATDVWEAIRGFGLEPGMKCVDYGCGSLRIGQHAMRFLDHGDYCGLDVVDTFMRQGLALIDPALIAVKAPKLHTITPQSLAEIADWQPDFIFSCAVLQHVPPDELPEYFRRLETMMSGDCSAHIFYVAAPRQKRVKALNWVYPLSRITAAMASGAPRLVVAGDRALPELGTVEGRERRVLTVRRQSAGA